MISVVIICILSIMTIYYFFKLSKIDKSRSDGVASIIVFSTFINILPVNTNIRGILIISILSLAIFLCRMSFKNIDIEKKKRLIT
ncbi:protein of unknown function [Acetoanaerobium sticklandii]|uniref:Uncharacterized protein n=1 Tax=Acetoanaerobium sticklandii (strain ATCC 12662 / DSM 519 / JCM 1433 / CCUG 9281 / NCIMB 10654 / HF) TaxID=499177 RepID=E3PWD1_ACESD|nr:hypothetical protein [Acetoanaerobium sticklandii]CBH20746.1 protein of unknown function [Acetoanaerobium sticklandii]